MAPLPPSGALLLCALTVLVVAGLLVLTWTLARRPMAARARTADRERAHLRLLEQVAVTANEASSVVEAVAEVLALVAEHGDWVLGHAFLSDEDDDTPLVSLSWHVRDTHPRLAEFVARSEEMTFHRGVGLPGQVISTAQPLWLSPVSQIPVDAFPRVRYAGTAGLQTFCGFPVVSRDEVVGLVEFFSTEVRQVDEALLALMHHLGAQLGRVVERERAERRLTSLALHDPLTGLANRRLFADRLDMALRRAQRHDTHVAVLLLDLDSFKSVNDSLGHVVGDELLQVVADRLRATVRTTDTVARLGGDEFAVAMTDVPSAAQAEHLCRRILRALREPVVLGDRRLEVRASVGISLSSGEGTTTTQLIRDADLAMYSAKGEGKGRAALFDPAMHSTLMERLDLEEDLRHAVERGELSLAFQPIVETATGRVRSREALLRWHHPVRGVVPPFSFIPVAEESGLIDGVGRWVLGQACADAAAWQVGDGVGVGVSVNLSPVQVRRGLVEDVAAVLARTGLPAHLLVLEVTESLLMDDRGGAVEVLEGLRQLGVRVSVDDFGTGHSSLGRLRNLPLDEFKIDRSFLTDIHDSAAAAIVETVIAMAAALGRSVVAEGVETPEQLDFLAAHGCEMVQGYLLGRPAPVAERGPDRLDVAALLRAASVAKV